MKLFGIGRRWLPIAILLTTAAPVALSQNARLSGRVTDPSDAAILGVEINITNIENGARRKLVTNEEGYYVATSLQPGHYRLSALKEGFKPLTREGLTLQVNDKVQLDLKLEIGVVSETISVTGETPMLRTQDAQIGEVVDSRMVENLPQLDRDPLNLLRLTGDISGNPTASNPAGGPGSDVRINGGRMQGMDVLIDGNTVMSGKFHAMYGGTTPSMEQVDEFKVITNGIPAEYGRVSGGLVTMATKSGTNGLHGQGFEYFKNQLLDSNSWEQNWQSPYVPGQKAKRLQFHQNDYGGAIEGPVILPKIYNGKNKTFFFFNFEGTKLRQAGHTELGMSASQADRNGDLSGLIANGGTALMYDPLGDVGMTPYSSANGGCPVATGCQLRLTLFPNNGTVIPAARINPLAQLVDKLMPAANRTPTPGWTQENAYLGYQSSFTNDARWETRIDHNFTDNSRFTLRFDRDNYTRGDSGWYDELNPGDQVVRPGALQGSLAWTWTATPTTIVEIRGSVMHHPQTDGYSWPNNEGNWPIDPLMEALTSGYPGGVDFRVWSSNAQGWGDNPGVQGQDVQDLGAETTYNGVVAVTKIWRQHIFKAGFETRRMYDNHYEKLFGPIDYQGDATEQSNDNRWEQTLWGSPTNSSFANSWGDWLLGMPGDSSQTSRLILTDTQNYYASYIQDDLKVNKRLTLNLGLRWDMETPLTDRHNDIYAWNPSAPSAYTLPAGYSWTGALQAAGLTAAQIAQVPTPSWVTNGKLPNGAPCYAGTPQCPSNILFKYHPWQFAPRLAAAYALNSKTVLRASWGMMYLTATGDYWDSWVGDQATASSPYPPDRANGPMGTLVHTDQSLFLPSQNIPFDRTNTALNYTLGSFYESAGTDVNKHPPLEQNWNFSIQRQLPWNVLLEAGYNGNHSGDLITAQPLSPYPANLVNPQYTALFQTQVANPIASQVQPVNLYSQPTEILGMLMLANPAFGGLVLYGQNIGRAMYNAGTLKVQKRFAQGVTFLATYTYSKSLDDVGTTANGGGGITPGSKDYQSFQTINDLYGYSPMDMTHRFTFYHDYQFPFGKGRKFLGSPKGVGGKVLDGIAGGWEYAGIWIYHSGTPLQFDSSLENSASLGVTTGVTVWDHISGNIGQITPSNFSNNNQLLTSSQVNVGTGFYDLGSAPVRRFNAAQFSPPVPMTPGNVPNIYPWIRNPGANSYDASLMKNFGIAREGKIYLQFRVEAQNLLNIRGLGNYDTQFGDPNFGLITSSAQNPRQMQISARLFF